MNARTIRRAQERKARKEARKQASALPSATITNQIAAADHLTGIRQNTAFEEGRNAQLPAAANQMHATGACPDTDDLTASPELTGSEEIPPVASPITAGPRGLKVTNAPEEPSATKQIADPHGSTSPAQRKANRENALLSTGPKTSAGKFASSLNAIKTGLTGRTVLLSTEDAELYRQHIDRFFTDWQPVGERESELVQSLADAQWRLRRIPALELGIYALARIEFAPKFADHPPEEAAALIQAQAFITYHKQLNNLDLQESRLRRRLKIDENQLRGLQVERQHNAQQLESANAGSSVQPAAPLAAAANSTNSENGFEFPNPYIEHMTARANLKFLQWKLGNAA